MRLGERGTCLSNGLWVREPRKRTERGHRTSILCTDYRAEAAPLAAAMFARWSQENFFKYAREHYNLDRLIDCLAPKRFPTPCRSSTPTIATSTGKSAPPTASSPVAWRTSPP